jgi:hypothetical protein
MSSLSASAADSDLWEAHETELLPGVTGRTWSHQMKIYSPRRMRPILHISFRNSWTLLRKNGGQADPARQSLALPFCGPSGPRPDSHLLEEFMDELDGHGAFADGGGDAFDGAGADVPSGEDAGAAGLEQERLAFQLPVRRFRLKADDNFLVFLTWHREIKPI